MLEEKKSAQELHEQEMRDIDKKIKLEELEQLKLSRQEREYSIRDLKAKLADREVREIQKTSDRETRGLSFKRDRNALEAKWKVCTHKKGGIVSERDMKALHFGGNANQYAVLKHQMSNGDIWVRCLRCGKTWAPPVRVNFYFDANGRIVPEKLGTFDQERFKAAIVEYDTAVQFPTNNTMSGSHIFSFFRIDERGQKIDAKEETRLALKDVNLT